MATEQPPVRLTTVHWLILIIASIGFAFDIYELLMLPLIAAQAISELVGVPESDPIVREWIGWLFFGSAFVGGGFGLIGGYLTDRFGRRRVLTWSILLYAGSAFAAGFSTSIEMFFILRCTTFIGVCVEFVAAVAWLAELFPNHRQRETILGMTQAFSSFGGLLVTGVFAFIVANAESFPPIFGGHAAWRYTLISGVIPALPLIIIRPFLPESPSWQKKKQAGLLKRPRFAELFQPALFRTTVVTTIMFACSYGAAFGALQLTPARILPGLPEMSEARQGQAEYRSQISAIGEQLSQVAADDPRRAELQAELTEARQNLRTASEPLERARSSVQFLQEIGGLIGRFLLAILAVYVVSRRLLVRIFQIPGLIVLPIVYFYAAVNNLDLLHVGVFAVALFTVGQFSFWGNYLPRVYPLHLRGTGESFAANVGGRMLGTSAAWITTRLADLMPGATDFTKTAYAAAVVGTSVYVIGFIASFWLPEPPEELLDD